MTELAYPSGLGDERIHLRPWRAGDTGCVRQAAADPVIPATTTVPAGCTDADARAWLEAQDRHRRDGTGIVLAIADLDDRAVGMVAVTGPDPYHVSAGLGFWIVPAQRRRSLATRAVRLLGDWALETLELVRLEARVVADNVASRRVVATTGFVFEGTLRAAHRLGEGWADAAMFARVRATPTVPPATWEGFRAQQLRTGE